MELWQVYLFMIETKSKMVTSKLIKHMSTHNYIILSGFHSIFAHRLANSSLLTVSTFKTKYYIKQIKMATVGKQKLFSDFYSKF